MSDAFRTGDWALREPWDWNATTILLVSHAWDPAHAGAEALAGRRLARHLLAAGCTVHVLAASRADVEWDHPAYTVSVIPSRPLPNGKVSRALQMIRTTVPEAGGPWVAAAVEKGRRLLEPLPANTIIYGRSAPGASNIAAWRLARVTGRVFVAHFSDQWPSRQVLSEGRKWLAPYKWPLFAWWRRRIVRDANALTFTNPAEAMAQLCHDRERYSRRAFTVTHLASEPAFDSQSPQYDTFHVVHTGNFYSADHTAAGLMKGIRLFLDRTPAAHRVFRFTQAGWAHGDLPRWVSRCRLEDVVHIRERLTQLDVLALLDRASLLVVIDYARPHSTTIMSKLPDYVNARRPLLAVTDPSSALSRLFCGDGAGLTAHYADPEQIAERIAEIFRAWQHRCLGPYLPKSVVRDSFSPGRALSELGAAFSIACKASYGEFGAAAPCVV